MREPDKAPCPTGTDPTVEAEFERPPWPFESQEEYDKNYHRQFCELVRASIAEEELGYFHEEPRPEDPNRLRGTW